jgi:hypothetical protein
VLRPKQRIHSLVMTGRSPAIHVFAADHSARCECVAGRCIIRMSQNTSLFQVRAPNPCHHHCCCWAV